ncbi:D-2-hydroxyacid dehydrogenase [Candidatus Marimicrobium litorale]|uniref:D-2-hydroxyacid dehydrogenase n=1 Tax=Candidatus Marimicrobium litorale TaxID=2518991 RepID=A0ABT3T3M1_9GAMM|nr:D-2-hydroxyacid dehydrogenase [Candidatus Marimicrobium litorale]MCX2976755.1 D-2-hydroxyacid dehydrogenase [Candidatus Marimicrobium litorale]
MTKLQQLPNAIAFFLALSSSSFAQTTPSPEAQALIEELGLRAATAPVANRPDWRPRNVAVLVLPLPGIDVDEFKQALHKAADGTDITFLKPGDSSETQAQVLKSTDGFIGLCTPSVLKQAGQNLRWIHNYFVGMDMCKGYSETQLDTITITNTKRLSGPAIAEHAIAMLLALTRDVPAYVRAQTERRFQRSPQTGMKFGELKNKTMLVVGLGGIGTEIARRAHGLGMRVIATRRSSRAGPDFVERVGLSNELHDMAAEADVIANALPLTSETAGIFNRDFFDATKRGAIFLSVGRGKSTVTADLVTALESGQLGAAGLDVTDPEPLPKSSPLWDMPNVIITPHVAAASADTFRRGQIIAVENLRRFATGTPLLNEVDLRKGY